MQTEQTEGVAGSQRGSPAGAPGSLGRDREVIEVRTQITYVRSSALKYRVANIPASGHHFFHPRSREKSCGCVDQVI